MSIKKTLSGTIEYLPLPLVLSNNLDNANLVPRRAMCWAVSQQRLGY
jgi:hypothetical protein